MQTKHDPKIIVALDFDNATDALNLTKSLNPDFCRVKVGKELFTSCGPSIVEQLRGQGFDVFLDLKFHDIPATVGKAVRAAANMGVWMVNVHASGGVRMMESARAAVESASHKPILIAVTVLTSMDQRELNQVSRSDYSVDSQVIHLAEMADKCGLNGVVCSANEAAKLKLKFGAEFILVTPGIRPENYAAVDDQRRVVTPKLAIQNGSDYLVVGRPITQAENPSLVCEQMAKSLDSLQEGGV